MLGAIDGSFSRRPFSNASTLACALPSSRKTSVLPHQIITARSRAVVAAEALDILARLQAMSHLFLPCFTCKPSSRFT